MSQNTSPDPPSSDHIETEAQPPRRPGTTDRAARADDGDRSRVAPRRKRDREAGNRQADQRGAESERERGRARCTERRAPEFEASDDRGDGQTDDRADDADDCGLEEPDADEGAGGGAASAEQCVFAPTTRRSGRGDRAGEQTGEHRAGNTQEQEQHLRVERVGPRGAESRREVVAHECRTRQSDFEIARRAGHLCVRGRRIMRESVR